MGNKLPDIGDVVTFNKRRGHVVGYSTFSRYGQALGSPETYLIIELDTESAGYLEKLPGEIEHDSFVSIAVVSPKNIWESQRIEE